MPMFPAPNSGGAPERAGGFSMNTPGFGGSSSRTTGEVMVSAAEAAILRALEFGGDDPATLARVAASVGMPLDKATELKKRADKARSAGITLKGPNFKLGPILNTTDQPGLLDTDGDGIPDTEDPDAAAMGAMAGMGAAPAARPGVSRGPAPTAGPSAAVGQSTGIMPGKNFAPPQRPAMSQATAPRTPARMGIDPMAGRKAPVSPQAMRGGRPTAAKPDVKGPAPQGRRDLAAARMDSRDPQLSRAYARSRESAASALTDCRECDGGRMCGPCRAKKTREMASKHMAGKKRRAMSNW